ncbi:hypothetical protein [Pseudoalteromonas sp. BSi20495]|uniref:hypothetical protein n=1 Tax=Pseudoalteromonas sp. BSi20495 TaxID=386429 RepID=UPI00023159C8|nr:hypothetical protein [Pseudoalteromonas sp. BSi20495]GAA78199.1 hypothetical protein P20495_0690 [Pseudoalteromonas sp. BSi20495]
MCEIIKESKEEILEVLKLYKKDLQAKILYFESFIKTLNEKVNELDSILEQ